MNEGHPKPEDLFAYRDGELSHDARGLVEAHVHSCTACRAQLDAMSAAEGALRRANLDPGEGYYERMTEAVMAKVAAAGAAAEVAAPRGARAERAVAEVPPAVRRRAGRRRNFEDEPRGRAPGLPWPAITTALSAAAAVVVVAVILVQRQDAWRHAPAPGVVGLPERSAESPAGAPPTDAKARAGAESAPPAAAPSSPGAKEKNAVGAPEAGQLAAGVDNKPLAKTESRADQGEAVLAPTIATDQAREKTLNDERDRQNEALKQGASPPDQEVRTQSAADLQEEGMMQKRAEGFSRMGVAAPNARVAQSKLDKDQTAGGFDAIVQRYGLPSLYDPKRVGRDALLRAEPEIRTLYQTGGAGEDSARARLYLAEAERLRSGDSLDQATYDEIVHHYRRAVQLARDAETARVARQRLEDFVSQSAPTR